MPLYDYEYIDTGEIVEIFHSMSEEDLTEYEGRPVRKKITSCSINAKGFDTAKNPKTLGKLAEQNTKRMIDSGEIQPKKKENPWWRPNMKKPLNIDTTDKKKVINYIRDGKS